MERVKIDHVYPIQPRNNYTLVKLRQIFKNVTRMLKILKFYTECKLLGYRLDMNTLVIR